MLAIPGLAAEQDEENPDWPTEQREMEEYYVLQMTEMEKYRTRSALPRKFPNAPPERITKLMDKFINDKQGGELKAGCKITITNPMSTSVRSMESFWFNPVVLNHLRKSLKGRDEVRNSYPLEGYEFCFENSNEDAPIQIILESVLLSDPHPSEGKSGDKAVFDASHLSPLGEKLEASIESADRVLKEMKYMEGRERRMRQTSDSINSRVRYFSYVSVTVLLVVTYVQVTYLKRYFRKKKLL